MGLQDKCYITCALSGVAANRQQCPAIPYTPEEYAAEARRAYEAGAAMVHIHARKPDGTPSFDVEDYKNIKEAILAEVPDIIINFSTGAVGVERERRIHQVPALRPEVAALNMGSMNYAIFSDSRKQFIYDFVFANPFSDIIYFLQVMNEAGVKPELECFDVGHIGNTRPLLDMGILKPPLHFSLILGVLGGIPATTANLAHMASQLPPDSDWQVIGISLAQWPLIAAAVSMGGHVRVGLEDNFYLSPGVMARSNGELVEKASRMVRDAGREVATPDEARRIMRLPPYDGEVRGG